MTHLLLPLLPLLASVLGEADPWVDNDLYYGTVYQVIHQIVAENVQVFSHLCLINVTKKLMEMMMIFPLTLGVY